MNAISLRKQATDIFLAGVRAADPYEAVKRALIADPIEATHRNKTIIISIGKAATKMAKAALEAIPEAQQTIVVTNYENAHPLQGAEIFQAGHPVPDKNGLIAAQHIIEILKACDAQNQILCLISGGASALLPAPKRGIAFTDKIKVNEILLGCGADIVSMNLVRQNLSRLKGGGIIRYGAPANIRALILSDVIGNDPRAIASGPTAQKLGTKQDAIAVLQEFGAWKRIPAAVRVFLQDPEEVSGTGEAQNRIVGSNEISVQAMQDFAPDAMIYPDKLVGDVQDAAKTVISAVAKSDRKIILFGGETTVQLTGNGLGGRNQELALRVALLAGEIGLSDEWVFLSGGTDGRDGPCDAAGGVVDHQTINKMHECGIDVTRMLKHNDSYHALDAVNDLLRIGATGTNVADLQVFIRR